MKAKEFILEYNRDITKRQYGNKIVDRLKSGPDKEIFNIYYQSLSDIQHPKEQINDAIAQNILSSFEDNDPTPNKQYTPWIAREYVAGNIRRLEDLSRVSEALKIYHQYKNKRIFKELFPMFPQYKDIGKLDASELENIAEKLNHAAGMAKTQDKGQAEEVYQDSDVRVISPLDEKAACYYGQGTRWCTAATKGENYFERYNSEGPLYIIIPKKPKYPGEKYQLHVNSEQFMDEKDDPVGISKLLQYPGFLKFLKLQEPRISNLLQFANPEVIAGINKVAAEQILEWTLDDLNDWESSDQGWQDYRVEVATEKGYVDEEGIIDWDRVHEDSELNDYFKYNDEAKEIYNNALEMGKWTPAQMIKNIETSEYSPDGNWVTIDNLEDIYESYGTEYLTQKVVDKIKRKLYITENPNKYKMISKELGTFGDYTVGVLNNTKRSAWDTLR